MAVFWPCWKERSKSNPEVQSLFSQLTCEISAVHTYPQMETWKKNNKKTNVSYTCWATLKAVNKKYEINKGIKETGHKHSNWILCLRFENSEVKFSWHKQSYLWHKAWFVEHSVRNKLTYEIHILSLSVHNNAPFNFSQEKYFYIFLYLPIFINNIYITVAKVHRQGFTRQPELNWFWRNIMSFYWAPYAEPISISGCDR